MRFVHTSDWQIGMKGGGLGEAAALVAQRRIETVDRILETAQTEQADFVLAAGDLFEDNSIHPQIVEQVVQIIRNHPGVEIHAITGNHDCAGPGCVWNRPSLDGIPNLFCHTEPGPIPLLGGEVTLHAFPVRTRYASADPLAAMDPVRDRPGIHIAVAHGHATTLTFGAHEDEITLPIDPRHVERTGLDYLALGHWHGTRVLATSDGHARIVYSGTHEQTAFRETDAGNVLVVEIASKGAPPEIRTVHTGSLKFATLELEFRSDTNLDRLTALLNACDADLVRLDLAGALPGSLFEAYRAALGRAKDRFRYLRAVDNRLLWTDDAPRTRVDVSDAGLLEVRQRLHEMQAQARGGEVDVVREMQVLFEGYLREAGL